MRETGMVVLTIVAALSLVMIGRGITGLVVSETCCDGPTCSAQNACDLQYPQADHNWAAAGALLLFICLALFIAFQLNER